MDLIAGGGCHIYSNHIGIRKFLNISLRKALKSKVGKLLVLGKITKSVQYCQNVSVKLTTNLITNFLFFHFMIIHSIITHLIIAHFLIKKKW